MSYCGHRTRTTKGEEQRSALPGGARRQGSSWLQCVPIGGGSTCCLKILPSQICLAVCPLAVFRRPFGRSTQKVRTTMIVQSASIAILLLSHASFPSAGGSNQIWNVQNINITAHGHTWESSGSSICVCSVSMHELFILQTRNIAYGHHRNLSPTTSVDRSVVLTTTRIYSPSSGFEPN